MTGHAGVYDYVDPAVLDPALVFLAEYLVFVIPLVLVALWFTGRRGKLDGLFVFAAVVAAIAISYGLGLVYSHPPPYAVESGTVLTGEPGNAFPSQHATAAFGMVAPLLYRGRRRLAAGFLVVALLVGVGRMATGLHYPVDVVGGVIAAGLGFGVVWVGRVYVERWARVVVEVEARVLGYVRRIDR
jgi:undecaprenyl-diphosphatase